MDWNALRNPTPLIRESISIATQLTLFFNVDFTVWCVDSQVFCWSQDSVLCQKSEVKY